MRDTPDRLGCFILFVIVGVLMLVIFGGLYLFIWIVGSAIGLVVVLFIIIFLIEVLGAIVNYFR